MSDGLPDEDSVAVLENDSVPNVSVSVGDWEVEKVSDGVSVDDGSRSFNGDADGTSGGRGGGLADAEGVAHGGTLLGAPERAE